MLAVIKSGVIACKNCKSRITIEPQMECVSTSDRNMGTEYGMEAQEELKCPACGLDIFVRIEAWEYPENVLNHKSFFVENAEMLEDPEIGVKNLE